MYKHLILALILLSSLTQAKTLPIPNNMIPLQSKEGQQIFEQSEYKQDFWYLINHFITQDTLTYCGVASAVMVLNALNIEAPLTPSYHPFTFFTQENFFTKQNMKIKTKPMVYTRGINLDNLAKMIQAHKSNVVTYRPKKISPDGFRKVLEEVLNDKEKYIIVNFIRKEIGEVGYGHFSPVGAYDKKTDRILILDVSRYKYPPLWMKVEQFWKGMDTTDHDEQVDRGFLVVSKPTSPAHNKLHPTTKSSQK